MNQVAMRAGRERARERRRVEAVARIRDWEAWCHAHALAVQHGCKAPPMPDVPRSGDYRLVAE